MLTARRDLAVRVTAAVFVLYAFPLRLLGLDRLRHIDVPRDWSDPAMRAFNQIVWFPRAFATMDFLRDASVLGAAFVFFALVGYAIWRARRRRDGRRTGLCVAVLGALYLQASLHTGMRSPYTYLAHFEPFHPPNFWYHVFILGNGAGAVESDWHWFNLLDNLFKGAPFEQASTIFMRPFINYIASPFTYFVDAYDVFLVLNPLLWFVAVVCTYDVVKRVCRSTEIARYAAALVACANGFLFYVAQPMCYLAYYAAIAVAVFAFERLLVDAPAEPAAKFGRAFVFGALLGLLSLTYGFFPVYPMLLVYAWYRRVPLRYAVAGCVLGLAIYFAYRVLYLSVLGLPSSSVMDEMAGGPASAIVGLFRHFSIGQFELRTVGAMTNYVQDLAFGFMVFAFVLALAGLLVVRRRRGTTFALIMLVPSLLVNAYFYYGALEFYRGILLVSLPRFTYIAYVGVYTAAALALAAAARAGSRTRYGALIPWAVIAAIAMWHNADAFGFPAIAYHFIWPTPSLLDAPGP